MGLKTSRMKNETYRDFLEETEKWSLRTEHTTVPKNILTAPYETPYLITKAK
jgi:hypothetical protein